MTYLIALFAMPFDDNTWSAVVAENVEALLVASLCFQSQKHNQAVLQLFVLPFADPFIFRHKKRKKLIEDGTATNR